MHANTQTLLIICILFSWEILQTYTFLPGKSLPFPTDGKHQSLRTQSAEPESTGFYTVLHHMQPSLRLINTSAANSAHSVTGLHVHALPYSWHCSHYGPNQYNQGSCQDILHRIVSLWYDANAEFQISKFSEIQLDLWKNKKLCFRSSATQNPSSMEDAPLGQKILDD